MEYFIDRKHISFLKIELYYIIEYQPRFISIYIYIRIHFLYVFLHKTLKVYSYTVKCYFKTIKIGTNKIDHRQVTPLTTNTHIEDKVYKKTTCFVVLRAIGRRYNHVYP